MSGYNLTSSFVMEGAMGFFDEWKVESVPQNTQRERVDTRAALISAIDEQIEMLSTGPKKVGTKTNDKGEQIPQYLKSWYNDKNGFAVPKVMGLSLFPTPEKGKGGDGIKMPADKFGSFLDALKKGVGAGDLDKQISDLDAARNERDAALKAARAKAKAK